MNNIDVMNNIDAMNNIDDMININNNYLLWTEKYRPTKLKDYLGNKNLVELITEWITKHKRKESGVERFLILHGCPGVGKTTLAHIIYNQFDYDIIECNASEQRSKKKIEEKIGSIGKVSVVFSENDKFRQIGLIMDEIDGVAGGDKGAITELIKIIDGKKKKKKETKSSKSSKSTKDKNKSAEDKKLEKKIEKKKREKQEKEKKFESKLDYEIDKTIKFPVICTCNSIKDKKLLPLIKKSLVINLNKPTKSDLIKLLNKIKKKEKIKISKSETEKIINSSNRDYRTLINNLFQFSLNNIIGNIDKTQDEIDMKELRNEKNLKVCEYLLNKGTFDYDFNSKMIEADELSFFYNLYGNFIKLISFERLPINKQYLINDIIHNICHYDNLKKFYFKNNFNTTFPNYYVHIGIIHNFLLLRKIIKRPSKYSFIYNNNFNYYLQEKSNVKKRINNYECDNDEKEKINDTTSINTFNDIFTNSSNKKYNLINDLRNFRYSYLNDDESNKKSSIKIKNIILKILN